MRSAGEKLILFCFQESMNSTVLFDFDGVIVNSIELFSTAVVRAAATLGRTIQFESRDLSSIKTMSIPEICDTAGIEQELSTSFIQQIERELYKVADQYPVYPGISEVLEHLGKDAHLGIVSATSIAVLNRVLSHAGLDHFFKHIVGGDMPGTKAQKILSIMRQNHHSLNQVCFIGDTVSDIKQGRAAGVTTIAVSWGWHAIEWIRTAEPDHEVQKPLELIELIQKVISRRVELTGT